MLSILIPTYNTDIGVLVDALYFQCEEATINYEIIFCEDKSTEYLEENNSLIVKYEVTKLFNSTNLGRTATRSKLAQAAKYDWLLFLDADVVIKAGNFISTYLEVLTDKVNIVSGGTSYLNTQPENCSLRWKYGKKREAKKAEQRHKNPFYIISQNILINKEIFLELNHIESRRYGFDNIFSHQIAKKGYEIKHINNPIVHLGLETNETFLNKSLEAVETIVHFEKKGKISNNFTSLQKGYLSLKSKKSIGFFKGAMKLVSNSIRKNLLSKNPSLFLFDLYRLHHYIKLKRNA